MRFSLRGTIAALKAAATLRRLQLPMSEIERRRRGFVVIQIDALSFDDLHRALDGGYMPHLKALLDSTHRAEQWRSGVPSDTAAIQCALMYGSKPDIPGFYWLDRSTGKPVICSWPLDMVSVERRNAQGRPGLFRHGSVYMGMAAGGAQRAVFTTSALGQTAFPPKLTGIDVLALLILHPYRLGRAVTLTVAEIFLGLYQTLSARLRRRYVTREGIFPVTRAITHVLFRELITLGIRLDIYRGVPSIYANFIGYDGVSHHLGPRSPEAYRTLKALDRQIRDIKRAIDTIALRPYDLYIMSDHGMTESRKFDHLFGRSLAQFIADYGADLPEARELDTASYQDMAAKRGMEELAADIDGRKSSITGFLADRAMRLAMRIGTGPLQAGLSGEKDSAVLAIYSSALANVYFTRFSRTPQMHDIECAAPGVLTALRTHPGIGLVLARQNGRVMALHAGGVADLEDSDSDALAFLRKYDDPEILAPQLTELARMPSAGDLLVFGAYDGEVVVSFEDHAGSHGGLGGVQMYPFMAAPREQAPAFAGVTDARQLHALFARRYHLVTESRRSRSTSAPTVAAR